MTKDNIQEEAKRETLTFKDYYDVIPPFGYAGIAIDAQTNKLTYLTLEPTLSGEEEGNLEELKKHIVDRLDISLEILNDEMRIEAYLKEQMNRTFEKLKRRVEKKAEEKYLYYLKRDFLGYGKINILMRDPNIEDISCNGLNTPIYIWHRIHESLPSNISYNSQDELSAIVTRFAYKSGRQISVARPILEGTLPEGYRVHLTLDEISKRGATFTIRKFRAAPYTFVDLIRFNTISPAIAAYLWVLVDNQRSVMVSGTTASGKTTVLNSICMFIQPEMKVVTIEEVRELRLHENWIPMVPRSSYQPGVDEVTLFDLLKSALRQRPDYIIVGEVRGEEAYTLFQSIATGHGGLCTIHSDTVETAMKRLTTRPMDIPTVMLPLMNIIVQIRRIRIGSSIARRITNITEIIDVSPSGEVHTQDRFIWNPETDGYQYKVPIGDVNDIFSQISKVRNISFDQLIAEMERRETVIKWMVSKGMNSFEEAASVVRNYYLNPEEVYNTAKLEGQNERNHERV
jgi:flagellar protein FlaI